MFEYEGYLMVKLDLVYKQLFSFYFIEIPNPRPLISTSPPLVYLVLPNAPTLPPAY